MGGSPGDDELVGDGVERGARVGEELPGRRDRLGGAEGRCAVGQRCGEDLVVAGVDGGDHRHRRGAVGGDHEVGEADGGDVVRRGRDRREVLWGADRAAVDERRADGGASAPMQGLPSIRFDFRLAETHETIMGRVGADPSQIVRVGA